jgi:hypothetical protein
MKVMFKNYQFSDNKIAGYLATPYDVMTVPKAQLAIIVERPIVRRIFLRFFLTLPAKVMPYVSFFLSRKS